MKTGRNKPCPCESGRKYKHCCISVGRAVSDEIKELLSGQEFNSIEELQASLATITENKNVKPQDDFLGLSSDQVFQMLNFPFDSPELFKFSEQLPIQPDAPILVLMEGIISAIDAKGLKATQAKGNLPQKLCRDVWSNYINLYPDHVLASFHSVNKEDDFFELHVMRIVLELAGFLRKTKGRFYVTNKYKKIASKFGLKGLYPIIFETYCKEFNWAYWDRYSDAPFIQQSFLFTLYMLKQYGEEMVATKVYENNFLRAFPMVINEMEQSTYSTPEKDLRRCYYYRAHKRFLVFFGLAELEVTKTDSFLVDKCKIKKTPLFDAVIQFNLVGSKTHKRTHPNIYSDQLH
ncbi:MAG: SEC-C domain-containing protein [Xanthomonadales bacterium]|nr:SEC-C domain-containing protein [Xanthomonadales bacterium]